MVSVRTRLARSLSSCTSLAALMAFGVFAWSGEAAAQTDQQPEQIVVTAVRIPATATKTDTPTLETPQTISVVSSTLMQELGIQRIEQALRYSAGVRTEPAVDSRRGTYLIRGFAVSQDGQYVDGLKLPATGGFGGWEIDPYDLERIEILKGPASVLYGQNAPGGLINQITKRPSDSTHAEVQLQYGSFDRKQASVDVGTPLVNDKVLARLVAVGRDADSQIDYVKNNRLFVAPSLTWRIAPDTSITLHAEAYRDRAGNPAGFFPAVGSITDSIYGHIPASRFTGEPSFDKFDRDQYLIGYAFQSKLNDYIKIRQNLRYATMRVGYNFVGGNAAVIDPRTVRRFISVSNERFNAFTVDNNAQINLENGPVKQTLLFGVDYFGGHLNRSFAQVAGPTLDLYAPVYGLPFTIPRATTNILQNKTQVGVYGQDQIKFAEKFILQVGGRYDWANSDTETKNLVTNVVTKLKADDKKFTGRVGVLYASESNISPFADFSQSFLPTAGSDFSGRPFRPTTGEQYEVGVKYQSPDGRTFAQVAAFQITQQNVLTSDPAHTGFSTQTGEVRSRGVEVEAQFAITQELRVNGSYTHQQVKITKSNTANLGKRPQYIPDDMANLWLDYAFPTGKLEGLSTGVGVRYVGETNDALSTLKVPSFTLVDLAIRYEIGPYRISVSGNNILDKRYVSACDIGTSCYYGATRTVLATLSYRWR